MPPVIIGAGIAAAGAVASSAIGSKASKNAAKTAAQSSANEIAFARENRDYQYNLNAPTIANGNAADRTIAGLLNIGGNKAASEAAYGAWRDSTGYASRLAEGLSATNNSAFAGGAGQSGAALKALAKYGQDYASNDLSRYMGALGGVSASGANARGLVAGVGSNATNQFINASQNGTAGAIGAINANSQNTQGLIQNLVNAGMFAVGNESSYGQKQAVNPVLNYIGQYGALPGRY